MGNKNSFVLFKDYEEDFEALTDAQAGQVIKAIFALVNGKDIPELDGESAILFRIIRRQIQRTDEAYQEKCRKNTESIKKRWAAKKDIRTNTNEYERIGSNTNVKNVIHPDPDPVPDPDPEHEKKEESINTLSEKRRDIDEILDRWNTLPDPIPKTRKLVSGSKRQGMLNQRLEDYGKDTILDAIEMVRQSDFLCGKTSNWRITFDWFIAPNNFIKVIEGNYNNSGRDASKVISPRDYLLNLISGGDDDEARDGTNPVYDSYIVSEQFSQD